MPNQKFPDPRYNRDHIDIDLILPGNVYLIGVCANCGDFFVAKNDDMARLKIAHVKCLDIQTQDGLNHENIVTDHTDIDDTNGNGAD